MFLVHKLERFAALVMLGLLLFLAGRTWLAERGQDKAQENYQAAAGDARAATVYVDAIKATQKAKETKNAEVEKALSAAPEYSGTAVPDDIADLLRHPSGAARAVP